MNRNDLKRLMGEFLLVRCSADEGDASSYDYCEWLYRNYNVQNFFFCGRNSENFIRFSRKFRDIIPQEPLISADFERGVGTNASQGTDFPGNMALAAARDPILAYRQGQAIAREMIFFGLNWNFAPCVDVNYEAHNPVVNIRSFGDDPQIAGTLGMAVCQGLEENGVLSCLKHFPGHGSVTEDSHSVLPVLSKDIDSLFQEDLVPFHHIIMKKKSSAVMIAHMRIPALQNGEDLPSSMSPRLISLLQEDWGFEGLILPDALEMEGALSLDTPYSAGVEALKAGNHFILVPKDPEKEVLSLCEAVNDGYLTLPELQNKWETIRKYKEKCAANAYYQESVDWSGHQALALEIARRSITSFQFTRPLNKSERILVLNCCNQDDQKLTIWKDRFTVRQELEKKGFQNVREIFYSPDQAQTPNIMENDCDRIVIVLYLKIVLGQNTLQWSPSFLDKIVRLQQNNLANTVVMSLADPYVAVNNFVPEQMLLAYNNSEASHQAVIEVATGERTAEGKLPFGRG